MAGKTVRSNPAVQAVQGDERIRTAVPSLGTDLEYGAEYYDRELADTLESERMKRARRVRRACDSTVPSLDSDEIAARVLHTLDSLKMSASGDGLTALSAGRPRRRGKAAPPSPRTPTPLSAATNGTETPARIRRASRVSGAPPDHSPIHPARDERLNTTTNGDADEC